MRVLAVSPEKRECGTLSWLSNVTPRVTVHAGGDQLTGPKP